MNDCGISYELMQRYCLKCARENSISWFEGIPYSDKKTDFEIRCIVFPLSGKELLLVPEGDRYRTNVWIYTQDNLKNNDVVIYKDEPYEVQSIQNWGSFIQARGMRIDVGQLGQE